MSTSTGADLQEQETTTVTAPTAMTSTVTFVLGELHKEKGPSSQTSGGSWESLFSGTPMLLGRGRGRGVRRTETPTVVPCGPGGDGEEHDLQPGSSGESGQPTTQPSGDSHELREANNTIRDLEG